MSGKRAIGAYKKGRVVGDFAWPAWLTEQDQRSKNPRAPRERKRTKKK